jgi:serine phosphatase RsbU (regulator of sigma subunit)
MADDARLFEALAALNQIAETLNQALNMGDALNTALARLVEAMELDTGWIFLYDPSAKNHWWGQGYVLAAHLNLPPSMALDKSRPWKGPCECQTLCHAGKLTRAYNEVHCSRLANTAGDRRGLTVHASTPLYSRDRILGILNVAAPDWGSFSPEALALLTNVGSQMGIAIERTRLFDLLREQRLHELAALLDLSNQLLGRLELDDVMHYLVQEVKNLLRADACALVLLDEDTSSLVFTAASGWHTDPVAANLHIPADTSSGPGRVTETQQPLVIEDLQAEDRQPWMPDWLRAERFRGHAVVPLIAEERSIGALIIDSRRARRIDEDELRFLRLMANQAAIALEKARLHQEALKRQRMIEELALARQIQLSILPEIPPVLPGWEFAATYRAARQVSGDFYDFFEIGQEPGRLGMVIADVSDKGIPSAIFMALCRTIIRTTALSGRSPSAALMRANTLILKDSQTNLFLSAFYATLDTASGQLIYANAGHNWPLWYRRDRGDIERLTAKGIILGVMDDVTLEEHRIEVMPGDTLVFYTDGVTEAMDEQGQLFGEDRLRAVVATSADATAPQTLAAIVEGLNAFTGDTPQSDDITLFVVKRQAGHGS